MVSEDERLEPTSRSVDYNRTLCCGGFSCALHSYDGNRRTCTVGLGVGAE